MDQVGRMAWHSLRPGVGSKKMKFWRCYRVFFRASSSVVCQSISKNSWLECVLVVQLTVIADIRERSSINFVFSASITWFWCEMIFIMHKNIWICYVGEFALLELQNYMVKNTDPGLFDNLLHSATRNLMLLLVVSQAIWWYCAWKLTGNIIRLMHIPNGRPLVDGISNAFSGIVLLYLDWNLRELFPRVLLTII